MTPTLRSLSARADELEKGIAAEPYEKNASGGSRLTMRAQDLNLELGRVERRIRHEVRRAIAAEKPAPESAAQPACGSCGTPKPADGCPTCDVGRLPK